MPRRTDARKIALQMLYLLDVNPDAPPQRMHEAIEDELSTEELLKFAEELVWGVRSHVLEIDRLIESVAQNWRIGRMAPTDRNVMRLAIFEMHHLGTPSAVAINEAVELAKEFGAENSAGFVNGIIDRLSPEILNRASVSDPDKSESGAADQA